MPELARRDRLGVLETVAMLSAARVAIAVVPFRWLRRLGKNVNPHLTPSAAAARDVRAAEQVKARIATVALRAPFLTGCLPQCVAGAAMLRLRGVRPTMHFGVLKGNAIGDSLAAHAWLSVGDVVVTGAGLKSAYLELRTSTAEQ